jgi:hypothetical protein
VTITGADLTGATKVLFGNTAAASYMVVSAKKIVAYSPPESAGTVFVTVTPPVG